MKKEKGIGLVAFIIIFVAIFIIGAVAVVLIMTGDKDNEKADDKVAIKDNNTKIYTNIKEDKEEFDVTKWGVDDSISTENANGVMADVYIKLPELSSMRRGAGQVADQSDDTLILMGGQHLEQSPNINSLKDVLSAYISQPIDVLEKYRRVDWQNYAFNIESSEITQINNYTMCKYVGNHTFTYNGEPGSMKFVAYATQLKSNGAYVYWMVLDESEGQSLTKTIEDYAYKMALSLSEL